MALRCPERPHGELLDGRLDGDGKHVRGQHEYGFRHGEFCWPRHTFTSGPDIFSGLASVSVTSPFSVTELYRISSNGLIGAANDTIDLSAVVPEPSTWAMLGIGFAGLGYVGFRKARARSAISIG